MLNADAIMLMAGVSLIVWFALEFFRGGFWRANQLLPESGFLESWPSVVVIIPARNEAATIGSAVGSIFKQKYPGQIHVIVVDDGSVDGTDGAAGDWPRLHVLKGKPLPKGWSGKLWAVHQGIVYAQDYLSHAEFLLMTDADIQHGPDNIRQLVFQAESEKRHLVSLMVMLRSKSFWERLLIPAFIFFFQKLYPFPWVNDPASPTAAAAGGCMLIRWKILERAGGIEPIRDQLIDDCAMGRLIKAHGPIWLGLTKQTRSLRAYDSLREIWDMVARTAFVQLDCSLVALLGSIAGMTVTYLIPPVAVVYGLLLGHYDIAIIGAVSWVIMSVSYSPTLKHYDEPIWRVVWLPVVAFIYTLMTISSALRYWLGSGSFWKGRVYGR